LLAGIGVFLDDRAQRNFASDVLRVEATILRVSFLCITQPLL
jgi:hypothetical protein